VASQEPRVMRMMFRVSRRSVDTLLTKLSVAVRLPTSWEAGSFLKGFQQNGKCPYRLPVCVIIEPTVLK
jgi:hypothetical protein